MKVLCMKLLQANIITKLTVLLTIALSFSSSYAQTIDPPDVSFVSINPYSNQVSVAWYKSTSDNIAFTRIHYIYDETGLIKAKTIVDIQGNTDDTLLFETDTMAVFPFEANEVPLSFAVDAYSQNGSNSTSLREYHTTMNTKISTQTCPSQLEISWSSYIGYAVTVNSYKIIEVDNTASEIVLETVPANQNKTIIPLNSQSYRRFFIEAVFTDSKGNVRTSRSNMVDITSPIYTSPSYIRVQSVTTTETNSIQIQFDIDTATSFTKYQVQRSNTLGGYSKLIDVELDKTEISPYEFTLTNGFSPDTTMYYRLVAFDNCNNSIATSQSVPLFTCNASEATDTKHIVTWNMPNIWTEGIATYNIYRITNTNTYEIGSQTNANTFIDDIGTDYTIGSKVCYRIEAIQNTSNNPYISISNTACVDKTYRLIMPNAINPTSSIEENRICKPTYAFISGSYVLQIFDRYGVKIFESNDIEQGWNGTYKNSYVNPGSYQYKLHVVLTNGVTIDRNGSITVIFGD
ncbi:MAG TPA: gliding motility-associated C-terminal domain-containing protein [Bacteroidales bacterium]|nr:gliding motility-associated C-terminal domain-containing protein [Bacteroidales bacterium]